MWHSKFSNVGFTRVSLRNRVDAFEGIGPEAMHTGAVLPRYIRRAETFKRVAETRPRPANVVGKGRFSLTDFLPGV